MRLPNIIWIGRDNEILPPSRASEAGARAFALTMVQAEGGTTWIEYIDSDGNSLSGIMEGKDILKILKVF